MPEKLTGRSSHERRVWRRNKDWQAIFSDRAPVVTVPNSYPLAFLTIADIAKRKRIETKPGVYLEMLKCSHRKLRDFERDRQGPLRKFLVP